MLIIFSNKVCQRQHGFSLVEIMVALALTGIIAAGIASSTFQIFSADANARARMAAIKQVELTIDRIRVDMQMAQEISNNDPHDARVKLILKWKEWDNTSNTVTYLLDNTCKLSRSPAYGALNNVAGNIQKLQATELASGNWNIIITAVVEGYKPASETRIFEIQPRSGR
jgi:prepilin-type N-terminal cleavage/methylation domain-containing protein